MKRFTSLLSALALLFTATLPALAQSGPTQYRVDNINALLQITLFGADAKVTAWVGGDSARDDGLGGMFFYDGNSSAATNVYAVFKPVNNNGRWWKLPTAVAYQTAAVTVGNDATYAWKLLRGAGATNFLGFGADNNIAYIQTFNGKNLHINNQGNNTILNQTGGVVGIGTAGTPASLTEIQGGLTTSGAILTLGTKEPSVVVNDVLGRINFYAPLDAAGTDANLVAGSIATVAEGTFSATSNASSLVFQTGSSETATTKMTITSGGNVTVTGAITATAGAITASNGNVVLGTAGNGLQIKEGSNARMGTATLSGGTIAVSNTSAATGDRIFIQRVSGTAAEFGHLSYTISNGVSFTINSTDAQDDSVVNWLIIKPTP